MKVFLYARPGQAHQLRAVQAMQAGILAHGMTATVGDSWNAGVTAYDCVVAWGDKFPAYCQDMKRLVLEAGYINGQSGDYLRDRLRFVCAGWNGMHGRADPQPSGCPPTRWHALGIDMEPWRDPTGLPFLVCEQHPGDSAAPTRDGWYEAAIAAARLHGTNCIIRAHPLVAKPGQPELRRALEQCGVCVTWSSTAGIEAVLRGVPTVALDRGSMVWEVASHTLTDRIYTGPREQWAYDLAYKQWTHAEMESGEAWGFLTGLI